MSQTFHYDENIRKWILQVIRQFSGFTYQALDKNGNPIYISVPCIWGDSTFTSATIARLNSENVMPSFPLFSIYISALRYDKDRTQNPTHVSKKNVRTRKYDFETNTWLPEQANAYSIQRLMPVPYNMEIKLDIVTSNTTQKLQILEQILPLYNPLMEIQKTDNYLDWESLAHIKLIDTNYSNRTISISGTSSDSSYDVCTLTFEIPIWMSLPAKVSKMGVVFKVITDINGASGKYLQDIMFSTRKVVTFHNYGIYVKDGQIRILKEGETYPYSPQDLVENGSGLATETNLDDIEIEQTNDIVTNKPIEKYLYGQPLEWTGILDLYGSVVDGITKIGLAYGDNQEITGTVTVDPTNPTILIYNVDSSTLPQNTLPNINMVVNPLEVAPGYGLKNAELNDSYLLTEDIGDMWPYGTNGVSATGKKNDIITYNGTVWETTFLSAETPTTQFVFDNSLNQQYKWDGSAWVDGWQGPYNAADWRMIL